jgi:hypothetical protein
MYICIIYYILIYKQFVVGMAISYVDGRFGIRIPVGAIDFLFSMYFQTGPGIHPTYSTISTEDFYRGKVAGAWS